MRPQKNEETLVDVLDVLLRDGAILRADVIVSVAEIPLVGIKLTAAIAGMETMTEYGLFEQWDVERRRSAVTRRQGQGKGQRQGRDRHRAHIDRDEELAELERISVGETQERDRDQDEEQEQDQSRAEGGNGST
ncbi:gas vesicle protein [Natronorubrum sp. JWXQ-INN-674]|uniref:Gas vesicle protein n=1 Tax=Natronorubrum halalkaliphilum TaxID=2691917 RepID=A0A6B0VKA7_9EURY|nr:gas vesicle protein [Natronorubrum halalkaliphilum]MXV61436.1 gas vesicle protein [Natronorubrum halalkaliphilum]